MRVVHVAKIKGIAGAERHLLWLLPALAARGIDVRMLVLEDGNFPVNEFREELSSRGVPVETLSIAGHFDRTLVSRLRRRFQELRPDVVHTHLIHADCYGLEAARRAGITATVSSRHDNNPFRRGRMMGWVNRRAMRQAGRIVAISHALSRFVIEVERATPSSVVTIHYGMTPEEIDERPRDLMRQQWGIAKGAPLVGVVGRLIEQKGIDVLIDALPAVVARHPSVHLVVVGEGPGRGALESRVSALGLQAHVVFAGWIPSASAVMPACDLIVVPSRWEGFGLVALEAMAGARPIVASAVDALPEIVENERTGLLVPVGDAAALAQAIDRMLSDRTWSSALGTAGRERLMQHFSVGKMADATVEMYGQLVS